MRNILLMFLLALTCIIMGCNNSDNSKTRQETDSVFTPSNGRTINTYVYRGVYPTKYNHLGVATMTLKIAEGSDNGSFVYRVDYGKGVEYEGQELTPYVDFGVFHSENSTEFGTLYVMKGQQPTPFYYQPLDNRLSEVDHEKKTTTGDVLTGIDPKDSTQTREEVLKIYNEKDKSGGGMVWSSVKEQKLDDSHADVKLEPISGDVGVGGAYIVFSKDHSIAELFLPNADKGLLLKRTGVEGNYIWTDGHYELFQWKGYVLRYKNGATIFAGN